MNLMDNLPQAIYGDNLTMVELQEILSELMTQANIDLDNVINQFFLDTASTLLSRHEKIYGIEVNTQNSDQYRREAIRAKVVATSVPTKQNIKEAIESFIGVEVEIIEDIPSQHFTVKFVGQKGIPEDVELLRITIDTIKPAHVSYEYEFTWNTWKDVSNITWQEASQMTWNEIQTYE